ncbi:FAD/FMN-dependent dehydrogenase [Saccharomonospora marina XMU15]|uniref:FAD/FMN-dependent dehydrogenase n=1 Tax=Saccharomonospora marina XMU15 TaxID=882083 RepID=H5XBZ4_9PSEU|nr:FAD-binding oxidoreductase [Saccharomonospora marina]EHR52781.1 FAD/FMN-dependent dehydrogenase [Saccharomonospora marina XMU15]
MTRSLSDSIAGAVIGPDDPEYAEARKVWNGDIDRRPALIVRCASVSDVVAAIRYAREEALEIAVRGGGHSTPGMSAVDDGLVIDLSDINSVEVDPTTKRARVGAGARLAELDAATQEHGLAVPTGLISHTGIAGLTLGGGMGWLTRQAGLTIDNLVSAEMVTADGSVLRVSENENPELFWAIRGGGGNFGVVTEFELALHDVGPTIQFGFLFWDVEQGPELLRLARDTIAALPRELNIVVAGLSAPAAEFVPEQYHLRTGYALMVAGFGSPETHSEIVDALRAALPPLFDFTAPMPYVALQQLLDEGSPWGTLCYEKSLYLEDLSDEVISTVCEQLPRKSSANSMLTLYRLDEEYSRPADEDTAFSGSRKPQYAAFVVGMCPTAELLATERVWVRSFWEALTPHIAATGTYVNAIGKSTDDRVRAAYGTEKYERLAKLKSLYDPHNVFHRNANIKPA